MDGMITRYEPFKQGKGSLCKECKHIEKDCFHANKWCSGSDKNTGASIVTSCQNFEKKEGK
jgi:hypothetical protein